jgi:hypothetical protein
MFNSVLLCFFLLAGVANSYGADPSLNWKTHQSEHFLIHYPPSLRDYVGKVDYLAEQSHKSLSKFFNWQPANKTHVILLDEFDEANGFASPIPNNAMTLFIQPPTQGELLVFDDWLKLLIHHEYTHILHIDKALDLPLMLRSILGRYLLLFPNALHPNWFQEGLATYMETNDVKGFGRGQSDVFKMMMRQEVLAGIKPLSRINTVNAHDWPFNTAYLYGVYFFKFIEDVYGKQAINQLVNNYSDNLLPYRVDSNPLLITGKTLDELWPDFQNYLNEKFLTQLQRIAKQQASPITPISIRHLDYGFIAKGRDQDFWYSATDANKGLNLYHYKKGSERSVVPLNSLASVDVNEAGQVLVSQLEHCGQHALYYDLYVLEEGELLRLTHCGRYRLAKWQSTQDIVALRYEHGVAVLERLNAKGKVVSHIWRGGMADVVSSFDVNESGDIVASIKFESKPWELYLWKDEQWFAITDDGELKSQPVLFLDKVYFIQSQLGQSEIYSIELDGRHKTRLSHSVGGFKQVVPASAKDALALSYEASGYKVASVNLTAFPALSSSKFESSQPIALNDTSLANDEDYNPVVSLLPKHWFPVYLAQGELTEIGFFTSGQDALNNHQYIAQLTYEKQHEKGLIDFNYTYNRRWILGLQQNLSAASVNGISEYNSQWFSAYMQPILGVTNSIFPYVAFIKNQTDFLLNTNSLKVSEINDDWLAIGITYDGLTSSLNAGGPSDGWQWNMSLESAEQVNNSYYTGQVLSINSRYFQTNRLGHTLAQRLFVGLGFSSNSPFRLGGERSDVYVGPGIQLKQRQYALRGFKESIGELSGENTVLYNIEYRLPFTWVDETIMAPPIGFGGWSLRAFSDNAMVWNEGEDMGGVYSSIGAEAVFDTSLVYNFNLRFRLGLAKGINALGSDTVYVQIGGSF